MKSIDRRALHITLLVLGTLLIVTLAYVPILRAHPGWEDEVYFASTCLSILRHKGIAPSVLADYPSPISPLRFYGPVLFWLGTAFLWFFGFSMRTWRTFGFAGNVILLAAVSALFYRIRNSWTTAALAAFVFSLSLGNSFGITLPGRMDSWTIAIVVFAIALVAKDSEREMDSGSRWVAFGALLGFAAVTTARSWPLLFLMVLLLPLLVPAHRVRAIGVTVISAFVVASLLLLPLRMSLWGFIAYVRRASQGDAVDVSPLMGGSWSFGHSWTQLAYYGALLAMIGLVYRFNWSSLSRFQRWLFAVGVLNLTATLLLTARALNMTAYWAFPLEIAAMCAITEHSSARRMRVIRAGAFFLLGYMVMLRAARELPALMHWHQRDPALIDAAMQPAIRPGSLVYGPSGRYFYPAIALGADYRSPVDWASVGRASTPGRPNLPSPMREACRLPAYLIWPDEPGGPALPPHPHAELHLVSVNSGQAEHRSVVERIVEAVPGGRSDQYQTAFTIYRLELDPQYCAQPAAE